MIRKVFLDTNVLMDLVFDRQPFNQLAEQVFELRHSHNVELYISSLTVAHVAYFCRKAHKETLPLIKKLLYWVQVVDLTRTIIDNALESRFSDFEDALQYQSARFRKNLQVIVTRNTRDFKLSIIEVSNPQKFLELFN